MSLRSFIGCAVLSCFIVPPSYATDISTLQTRAAAATSQEQISRVLKDLNEYLHESAENNSGLFLKARLLEKTGQSSEAEAIYQQLIEQNPQVPEPYNNLARLKVAAGDLDGAQTLLEKAIRSNPSFATVYDNLSQIYVAMARDSYGKALRLETPEQPITLTELTEFSAEFSTDIAASANKQSSQQVLVKTAAQSAAPNHPAPSQPPPNQQRIKTDQQAVQLSLSGKTNASSSADPVAASDIAKVFDDREIITTLEGWAAAWSEQAPDVYFIFYADDYHPPGQSRRTWEQERRLRLEKPRWIQIGLKDIEVRPINNNEARIELIQEYRASNYQDKTKKELKMRQTPDGWRIVAERSVSKLN